MIGMHFNDPLENPPKTDWVRLWDCGVTWKDIHLEPNTYDWSKLDSLVELYYDRKILYVACSTPRWLAKNPNAPHFAPWLGPGSNSLPSDIEEWNKFVWNLATRYKGKIDAYEIWNEPQLADFMYPYTLSNRNLLATMTKRAYRTIKSIDKNVPVLSPSVLPRKSSGGMKRGGKMLHALKRKGWPVDAIATHIYPEVGSGVNEWRAMLNDVSTYCKKIKAPREIWVTETTFNLLGFIPSDQRSRTLISRLRSTIGIDSVKIFWYSWDKSSVIGGLDISHNSAAWKEIQDKFSR
jgi:GH35 family endo-1,4-beta-xylanase